MGSVIRSHFAYLLVEILEICAFKHTIPKFSTYTDDIVLKKVEATIEFTHKFEIN